MLQEDLQVLQLGDNSHEIIYFFITGSMVGTFKNMKTVLAP